ncbi:MAG: hypothetical protein IAC32_05075 [Bacteroidetes bacterium]|uniref:Uncharacterized protein n=1 Tax=Candidatus Enterocola intestinipullorum TaxID=2840783 RepID=A0A9D9EL08_9BACT|nr:hypothetical protein [Candidatus Enterocola intestinipullorum]
MRYIGLIVVLLGALALIIPALAGFETNVTLVIGGILLVAGVIVHGICQRSSMDKESKV